MIVTTESLLQWQKTYRGGYCSELDEEVNEVNGKGKNDDGDESDSDAIFLAASFILNSCPVPL